MKLSKPVKFGLLALGAWILWKTLKGQNPVVTSTVEAQPITSYPAGVA